LLAGADFPLFIGAMVMIKPPASLAIFGAVLAAFSCGLPAREAWGSDMGMMHGPGSQYPDMGYNSPFAPSLPPEALSGHSPYPHSSVYSGIQNPSSFGSGSSAAMPRILLPLPINSPMWGFQTRYGFQYPGSYLPAGTPLHRYNGYIVCDPPAAAAGKRIVKITTTRSLAAPGDTQPCPVYTINGEVPKAKSYTTTNAPPVIRNPPP